jgi:hypothetical protein
VCDVLWFVLQPQSPHFTITYQLRFAQISSKIPKAWSA